MCVVYNIDRPRHRQTNKQRKCVGDNDMMIEINPSEKEKSINDHSPSRPSYSSTKKKKYKAHSRSSSLLSAEANIFIEAMLCAV